MSEPKPKPSPKPKPTLTAPMPGLWREAGWILAKDLRAEGRTLAVVGMAALLTVGVVSACALAGIHGQRAVLAPAAIWIALAFAGIQAASGAYEGEQSTGTLSALLCGPVRSMSLFVGKTAGILIYTLLGTLTALVAVYLLIAQLTDAAAIWRLLAVVLAGSIGFSLLGGLIAPLLGLGAGRDALLALLVLPLGVPLVVAGARATQALYATPIALDQYLDALGIVAGLDALYLAGAIWLFEPLVRRSA